MAAISLILIIWKNFQLPTPSKFGSLVFWVSTEMEYQCLPLWKNWKMAAISLILIVWKNFQLPAPPKFGSMVFRVSTETAYQCWPLWKNWKMAAILLILIIQKNFKLLTSPKVWVPSFPSVDISGISRSAIMKKLKNGCHFINIDHMEKISNYWPPQSLSLLFSECQWKWNISVGYYEKIEKWLPFC